MAEIVDRYTAVLQELRQRRADAKPFDELEERLLDRADDIWSRLTRDQKNEVEEWIKREFE